MPSTPSSRAISPTGRFAFLYCMADVRETTRRESILGQHGNEFIGHAVGEIVLRRIAGEVRQRKYRDGANLPLACSEISARGFRQN